MIYKYFGFLVLKTGVSDNLMGRGLFLEMTSTIKASKLVTYSLRLKKLLMSLNPFGFFVTEGVYNCRVQTTLNVLIREQVVVL